MKDAHGIRGELFIVLFAGEAYWLPKMTTLRLVPDAGGAAQEFPVKSARPHKNGFILKSNDIKDRNQAETLKGLIVEIPEEFLISEPGEAIYLREILNFILKNDGVEVGRIVRFASNTVQDLLVVSTPKGEFEIPFVEAFVNKVNFKTQTIDMKLPYGLLGETDGEKVEQDGKQDHMQDPLVEDE
jgi:16S rRNA processing protein RimM